VKKRPLLIYTILLFLAVTAAYINHFHNGFHFDDSHSVVDNPYIRDLKNVPLFFTDGTTSSVLPQNQSYRPVVSTSLALDYKLGNGYDLFAFHITTFILFLVQGFLMLIFFKKLLSLSSANKYLGYVALFATAWYMLHPAIAETINYIIARSDVISTAAVIGGFVLYTNSVFCRKTFLYLIPVGIGALAKPPSVMFAPLLFCYILLFEEKLGLLDVFKRSNLNSLWNSIKKSLPAFIFCALMYLLIDKLTPKTWAPGGNSPIQYLITQPYVILHYFGTFFWPTGLSADSDWGVLPNIWSARFFVGCAFILLMFGAAFYTSQKAILRPISFGILWFFLALIPTSSIIPLGEVLNDHRMYFPFIGLAISVSWALGLIVLKFIGNADHIGTKHKVLILAPVLLLLCTCAYGTWKRNVVWRTEESLWFNVTVKSPENGRGMMNYGVILIGQAKFAEAQKYLNRAAQLAPNYSYVYVNMGVLKEKTGDFAAAENYFLQGIRLGSAYPVHYFLYGKFLYRRARFIEAEAVLQKSMQLSNSDLRPRELLIKTYGLLGEWDLLKNICVTTLKISPGNGIALNGLDESSARKTSAELQADKTKVAPKAENYLELSLAYYNEGKYGLCIEAAKKALVLKPNYVEAYNNIGCAYNILNQFDKSVAAFKTGLSVKPDFQLAKNNLALSEAHRYISDDVISSQIYTAVDYVNQSLNYYNQGQYELCIAACVSALVLNRDYDLAYNNLCAAYNKLGEWDDAITVGEKGLKINPNSELLKNNVAQAEWNKKNRRRQSNQ